MIQQRGLKVWFRDEIYNTINAVDIANRDIAEGVPTQEMIIYRRGYVAALRAVAAAFGLSIQFPEERR